MSPSFSRVIVLSSLLSVCLSLSTPSAAASSSLDALEKLPSPTLQEILPSDHRFISALLILQRRFYQEARWQEFFAQALFYRSVWLPQVGVQSRYFKPELIALETFALIQHCRWKTAMKIGLQGLRTAEAIGLTDTQGLERAIRMIRLHAVFPEVARADPETNGHSTWFSNELHWKIDSDLLKKVKHPSELRVRINHQCPILFEEGRDVIE